MRARNPIPETADLFCRIFRCSTSFFIKIGLGCQVCFRGLKSPFVWEMTKIAYFLRPNRLQEFRQIASFKHEKFEMRSRQPIPETAELFFCIFRFSISFFIKIRPGCQVFFRGFKRQFVDQMRKMACFGLSNGLQEFWRVASFKH